MHAQPHVLATPGSACRGDSMHACMHTDWSVWCDYYMLDLRRLMETHMLVQHSVRSVAKGDVDELQDRRRQLPHVCEVELHRVFPRNCFCEATPHLHRCNRSDCFMLLCFVVQNAEKCSSNMPAADRCGCAR